MILFQQPEQNKLGENTEKNPVNSRKILPEKNDIILPNPI